VCEVRSFTQQDKLFGIHSEIEKKQFSQKGSWELAQHTEIDLVHFVSHQHFLNSTNYSARTEKIFFILPNLKKFHGATLFKSIRV
jgi:hypothetical protein